MTITWNGKGFDPSEAVRSLEGMGYRANPFQTKSADDAETRQMKFLLRCLAVAGFAAMNIMLLSVSVWSGDGNDMEDSLRTLFHWLSALIAIPAVAYAGQPFFRSALAAINAGRLPCKQALARGLMIVDAVEPGPMTQFLSTVPRAPSGNLGARAAFSRAR